MTVAVKSVSAAPARSLRKGVPKLGVGHLAETVVAEAGLSERLRLMRIEVDELLVKAKRTRARLG